MGVDEIRAYRSHLATDRPFPRHSLSPITDYPLPITQIRSPQHHQNDRI
ncbi:hypothetical protein [Egbenema bharatensis]